MEKRLRDDLPDLTLAALSIMVSAICMAAGIYRGQNDHMASAAVLIFLAIGAALIGFTLAARKLLNRH